MLSTLVRAQLVVEWLAYLAVGVWLHETRGCGIATLLPIAVALVLATRLGIVCVSASISHGFRSPREPALQLGPGATARLLLREWGAMLRSNFWRLPWEAIAVRADPPARRGGMVPVLLVHGYLSNRGMLRTLLDGLEQGGASQVFTLNFRGIFCPIDDFADQLEARVEEVLAATGQASLVIVAHSMGGLVTRLWLTRKGAARVAHLVTIASPHHGTVLAALGSGRNARQMRRGSEFLRALAGAEGDRGPACPATSIYSVHDNLVSPQDTSRLPQARNVALPGWGHVTVVGAPPTVACVLEVLRSEGAA
ncbi:hypothetical protein BWI17_15950 [Betaproteobacteria bacterium GR16-43]|nr:hypothetical protein BWI17_15950 [Betaproteobacteria bacterium GR16-43]